MSTPGQDGGPVERSPAEHAAIAPDEETPSLPRAGKPGTRSGEQDSDRDVVGNANCIDSLEVRRHRADRTVAAVLREINYDVADPRAQLLIDQLSSACAGSLYRMWKHGDLFARAARLGCPFPLPWPPSWPDEAFSILNEAAWSAGPKFVGTRMARWDPEGGASLVTFYTNFTIGSDLKTAYCRFRTSEHRRLTMETPLDEELHRTASGGRLRAGNDEIERVLDRMLVDKALAMLDPHEIELLRRISDGESQAAIARDHGRDARAVGRDVQRRRQELRARLGWTTEDGGR